MLFFAGDTLAGLEDRINSLEAELTSKMESYLAETTASADLLRCDYDHQRWANTLSCVPYTLSFFFREELQEKISEVFLSHNSHCWGWVTITILSRALTSITSRNIPLIESSLPFIQRSLPLVQRLQPFQQRSLPLCELSGLPQLEKCSVLL